MLRAILTLAAALGCFGLLAFAQPGTEKKTEPPKGKADGQSKSKDPDKFMQPEKGSPKGKTPLDKLKLPKDAVIFLLDDPAQAMALFVNKAILPLEEWLDLHEKIKTLERQLKPDRKIPSICNLTARVDGDFLVFRGEFVFSTEAPNTAVPIGLLGGHLLDAGDLDGQAPIFDHNKDEGFVAKVEKEAMRHQLTVNFRVPIQVKKTPTGALERGIEVSLPGAVVTTLSLELPAAVKELRCNETLERTKSSGRWHPSLAERSKSLSLAWKEPVPLSGNAALAKAEAQIKVDVDSTHVNLSADLFLEDSRLQMKEWHLLLPKQAKLVEVKAPAGLTYEWVSADEKTPYHILRTSEATAERWQVSIALRVPRTNPGARVAVGPFHVLGAFEQKGTISVKMPAAVSLGQRLVFGRGDGIYDIIQTKNFETEAAFNYVGPAISEKNLKSPPAQKPPLELEWHFEKNQLRTQVEHTLKLQTTSHGYDLETTTQIQVEALFASINAVDLKLPQPRPRGVGMIGTAPPGLAFPGSLPWAGIGKAFYPISASADPDDFTIQDELGKKLELLPQDGTGKTRVLLERGSTLKQLKLILKSKMRIPQESRRIRIELPRPLNTQDRGATTSIETDERSEILYGPPDAEDPVPDRTSFKQSWDQSPSVLDLAWRPYHRDIVAHAMIDIVLHERTAQVKQRLQFPRDLSASGPDAKNPQVALKVPRGIDKVELLTGGTKIQYDVARQTFWLSPPAGADTLDLTLQFDLPIANTHVLQVTPIWPANVSQKDVKVRVWSSPGVTVHVSEELVLRRMWKERSIEIVKGKNQFPALVLQGYGANLPLSLKIEDSTTATLTAFLAERALIQVRMADDGSQQCKARYLIRSIHAPHVDIELPLAMSRFPERPTFSIGRFSLPAETIDEARKVVHVTLYPDKIALPAVLEINYTIPANGMEGNLSWRTILHAPTFRSEVAIAQMRWQLTTPKPMLAASLGRNVRADVQWGLQNWLPTPESSVTSVDLDLWLTGKEPAQELTAVTYSFADSSVGPPTVYHLPRPWWLGCSGVFLVLALSGYFSRLPRPTFWLLLLGFGAAVLSLGLFAPAFLPPILFGLQPGMVLFAVLVGFHKYLQERHRRRMAFQPGFSRAKPNSTIVRTQSAKRPREASTVDGPGSAAPAEEPAAKTDGAASG